MQENRMISTEGSVALVKQRQALFVLRTQDRCPEQNECVRHDLERIGEDSWGD
jgi:hypothetical protein